MNIKQRLQNQKQKKYRYLPIITAHSRFARLPISPLPRSAARPAGRQQPHYGARTIFHPIGAHESRSAPAARARRAAPCLPPEIAAVSQSPVPCITVVVRARNEEQTENDRSLQCMCVRAYNSVFRACASRFKPPPQCS